MSEERKTVSVRVETLQRIARAAESIADDLVGADAGRVMDICDSISEIVARGGVHYALCIECGAVTETYYCLHCKKLLKG